MIKVEYKIGKNELKEKFYEKIAIQKEYNGKTKFINSNKKIFQIEKEITKGKNKGNKIKEHIKNLNLDSIYKILNEKDSTFKEIFKNYTLKELITVEPERIQNILNSLSEQEKIKSIEFIFNYTDLQKDYITPFFQEYINNQICFYCNKEFITSFAKNEKDYCSTFQLDHFYDKGKYPYLALSFYNLIPSCATCNSGKVKGTKDCFKYDKLIREKSFDNETCLSPNHKNFNFENKVKFKLFLSDKCKNLDIKNKESIEIPLKENYSNEYDKYIEVFKLNERYKAHKDIVYEMITKAELYPESRLKELQDLTGIPFQQIKKDIFNLSDEKDLSKKPFSKLIKDIAEELKL